MPTVREFLKFIESERGVKVVHDNRVVGRIYIHPLMGKVYVTIRSFEHHVFKKWRSIGVSRDVIQKLIKEGVRYVVVVIVDKKIVIYTTPQRFIEYGQHYWNERDKDSQLHLKFESFILL